MNVHIPPGRTGGDKPKIAFLLPALGAGGSEHVVTFLSNHLVKRGYSAGIFSFEDTESQPYYACDSAICLTQLDIPIGRNRGLQGVADIVRRVLALRRAVRKMKPDILISFLTRTNVIAVLATWRLGFPVVVSERNNPAQQRQGRVWQWLRRWTYPRAHGLVTMTQGVMQFFPKTMRQRGWVIPNMADRRSFKPQESSGRKVISAVGRLTDQKGFDLLIKAFAEVAHQHPDWILRIWGEGHERQGLESLIEQSGLTGRVEMPGVSSQPGSWIENSDAFVLSSRYEGWGLVLGEAMAAGLPCISFNCDFGPTDMITHGVDGLLVPNGDVDELAEAIDQLLVDGDLREMLGSAAEQSSTRFDPDQIVSLWEAMIEEVLVDTQGSFQPQPGQIRHAV